MTANTPATRREKGKAFSKYRRWTDHEDDLLKMIYNNKTLYELGEIFNRKWDKISRRLAKLGLKKDLKLQRKILSERQKENYKNGIMNQGGKNNSRWKGGKRICNGYVLIYSPKHPSASKNYVSEHRLVMEKKIGRYLTNKEVVHHIDHNPLNNSINNLYLCKDDSEHKSKFHLKECLLNISKTPTHRRKNANT